MPQLMPLLWIASVFMVSMMIFMLVDMYYFGSILFVNMIYKESMSKSIYLW